MSTSDPEKSAPGDGSDEILARADALLARHRQSEEPQKLRAHAAESQASSSGDDSDIPLLTDIAPDPDLLSPEASIAGDSDNAGRISGTQIISRVHSQNLQQTE